MISIRPNKIHPARVFFLAAIAVCFSIQSVEATGILFPKSRRIEPSKGGFKPLSIKSQHVDVSIDNQASRTTIKQVFLNHTNRDLEGTYIFPIPEDASISEFSMWMNGKKVEGELLEAGDARKIYNDIVRRMRDPGLLEYAGRNIFRANVYPIPKHGEVKIEIAYEELLKYDAGLIGYRYPLNTERFCWKPIEEVSVAVRIRSKIPIKNLYSPSHDIDIEKSGDIVYCGFEEEDVRPDRDFILYYAVSEEEMGLSLLTYRSRGEDGYFMLLMSPGEIDDPDQITDKDIVFVIDKSGSMRGKKIEQAKDALEFCLRNLNKGDRFNVIAFSTGVDRFKENLVPVRKNTIFHALRFVDKIEARGGTNINEALLSSLEFPTSHRPQMVIFLTDGLPTVGITEIGMIIGNVKGKNEGNVRIFPFGVGHDVNTDLLDGLSGDNRGTVEYIKPEEDIEEKVSTFYSKVSNPVLSDISVDFGGIKILDVYPNHLPDIFNGSQLVVFGRYEGSGTTPIRLTGYVGEEKRTFEYKGYFGKRKKKNVFIPRLWATRKVANLLSEVKLHGYNKELVDEIVVLALEHGIITPYTSYLVVEENEVARSRVLYNGSGEVRGVVLDNIADGIVFGSGAAKKGDELRVRGGRSDEIRALMPVPSSDTGERATHFSRDVARDKEQSVLKGSGNDNVKYVGEKTFYKTKDGWLDKDFDEKMEVTEIKYMGYEYFKLIDEEPEVGKILSLGTKITFVFKGKAYRIVE